MVDSWFILRSTDIDHPLVRGFVRSLSFFRWNIFGNIPNYYSFLYSSSSTRLEILIRNGEIICRRPLQACTFLCSLQFKPFLWIFF